MERSVSVTVSVDPRDYRSFCFRGEGRANMVISAKHKETGFRIVWRFAKAKKTGYMTFKGRGEFVNRYMEACVTPFFSDKYLVAPKIVDMSIADVHELAKMKSLVGNVKIESFEDLLNLPSSSSYFPLDSVPAGICRIISLEMIDATRIPKNIPGFFGSTITVEIKPKQGFFQDHPGVRLPYCNNCVLQLEKCGSDHFDEMYEFCPLDLFSGFAPRVLRSLSELLKNPHRNLRLFVDGNLVHSNEFPLDESLFENCLFPTGVGNTDSLISALALILTGSPSFSSFKLHHGSVLHQILEGQRVDTIGIVRAYKLYNSMSPAAKRDLLDKSRLRRNISNLKSDDPQSLVERYLLAATMKDCSVMASLRLISTLESYETNNNEEQIIVLPNGLRFIYSIKIVDLDPKSPKNLINAHSRFMAGVKLIRLDPSLRRSCI